MRLLFVLLMSAIISVALGGLVRREADPEAEADPHRRHGGHHRRHHSSSYYRPSYSSNYYGYNNYNNNNYRPNTPIRDLLPLKAAALAGAVGGFKVASILG